MEYVVLALLIISPMTIYDINKSFEIGISGFYSKSYGGIQNAIKNLLKKSYISFAENVENGRNKKIYSITDSGSKEFFEWMYTPIPENKQETNILTKLYFLGLIEDNNSKKEILNNIISAYRDKITELENTNREICNLDLPDSYLEIFKYQKKTLELGLTATKNELEWFRRLLNSI